MSDSEAPLETTVLDPSPAWLTEQTIRQIESFRTAHETQVLTILLSDLEASTDLQSRLGNVEAARLVQQHRAIFRQVLVARDGQEVETAGDSFLAVFAAPSEAVRFALVMQAEMRKARQAAPALPAVRVGIHQGQVVVERHDEGGKAMDIYGLQVSTAARIMDLAKGGQVLCSRAVFDDARAILRADDLKELATVAWRNHGPYRFKGVEDSYEICEVGEEGQAPLAAPAATGKSWPADRSEEELGWRPAVGVVVPGTNWVLEERLGKEDSDDKAGQKYRGEFGEVWKAWNQGDKSRQVFKFCFRRDRLPALKREARLLKHLRRHRHPNLVEVYDVTEGARPPYYLEMEYVEGPTLEQWLASKPPRKERLEIIAQVADALDTAHAAGIYHRDIKPSNILLTHRHDGTLQAKLSDFGLGAADDTQLLQSIAVSRVERIAGTWDYIAPELRAGSPASAQSDLYSLGLTLLQLTTGDLSAQAIPGWEGRVDSEILQADIARCMAAEPGQRWERARELATALRSHDERLELLALERQREQRRRRARRLRRLTAVAGAAVAVALAALIYWWRVPGTLELQVQPVGASVEVAGKTLAATAAPISLPLHAGYYDVRVTADGSYGETRGVLVQRNGTRQLAVALRRHQGVLDAECQPTGSEILINGVPYGSRVRNLTLDAGTYELTGWANDRFEVKKSIKVGKDQHIQDRLWLDSGRLWTYTSPAIQGAGFLVADLDGDGKPDIAQNELNALTIVSSATGEVLHYLPAPASGSRSIEKLDLGGEAGTVLLCAKQVDASGGHDGGLEVFAVRTAAPKEFFWRWRGPARSWKNPEGCPVSSCRDLNGDGVGEVVVASRDGTAYVLSGRDGSLLKQFALTDGKEGFTPALKSSAADLANRLAVSPKADSTIALKSSAAQGENRLLYALRKRQGDDEGSRTSWPYVIGCLRIADGESLWNRRIPDSTSVILEDLTGDNVPEAITWSPSGWSVLDGTTGDIRSGGKLPDGAAIASQPWLAKSGDRAILLLIFTDPAKPMQAVDPKDGKVLWQGPAGGRQYQPCGPGGWLKSAPGGEILVATNDALLALDGRSGKPVWKVDGKPDGILLGDWQGDGKDEIFVTMQSRGLLCLDQAGRSLWTLRLNVDVRPYAMLGDIDGDGLSEVLIHRHAALWGAVRGPRLLWSQSATAPLQAQPLVVCEGKDRSVFQLGSWGGDRYMACFDATSGAVRWTSPLQIAANRAPALADWNGDGRSEIIDIADLPNGGGSRLVALRVADGQTVCSLPVAGNGAMYSTPIVTDLNGDGQPDLAVSRWDRQDVIALDGKTGQPLWRQSTKGPNMGGVAAADLDGDGRPDVVASSTDGFLYGIRGRDGKPIWPPVALGAPSRSPPRLHDVTGDGVADVLVVTMAGSLCVIDGRSGSMLWRTEANGASEGLGRPACLQVEGRTIILVPLGLAGMVAFDAANHKELWRSPPGHPVVAGPTVCDLDGDGLPEVLAGSTDGQLLVLDAAGGAVLQQVAVSEGLIEADPAVCDVDGDGVLDVLIASQNFNLTAVRGQGIAEARKRLARQ